MSLANIKLNNAAKSGFTIVELLIVVVVIAILAAITIVSYNGITTKANASAAKSTAATWQKKIELYQAEKSAYPFAVGDLSGTDNSYYIDNTSTSTTQVTNTNGKSRVHLMVCGATAAPTNTATTTGVVINYWNYEKSPTPGIDTIKVGTGTSCTTVMGGQNAAV